MIFKLTRVVVDRYGAIGWHYLTGSWPGEKRPDPDDDYRDDETALAVVRERVLEAGEVVLQEQLQLAADPRLRRRVVAEQLEQDLDLRAADPHPP